MNTKNIVWLSAILGLVIIILLGILFFVPAKNSWKETPLLPSSGISVILPKPNETVSLPMKITGVVNGDGWSGFEGQVGTVEIRQDSMEKDELMARVVLKATSDWTKLPTAFEADITDISDNFLGGKVNLVFHNENPSGDPAKDKTFTLPIKVVENSNKTISVKVYFSPGKNADLVSCDKVFAVERNIPKTSATATSAINELLKGPTDAEKAQGYATAIPAGSKLDAIIRIVDGVAWVDFNEVTESGGGSCSMTARVAQITQTLLQFPTIKSVRLSIAGRTSDIFQPQLN